MSRDINLASFMSKFLDLPNKLYHNRLHDHIGNHVKCSINYNMVNSAGTTFAPVYDGQLSLRKLLRSEDSMLQYYTAKSKNTVKLSSRQCR